MPSARRRLRHFPIAPVLRGGVALLAVVAVIGALAYCAALLLIDPNEYKSEIEAAVQKATGRMLALRGPTRVEFGVPPLLVAEDVAFANPDGASREQIATLERVEARIAVLPLLSGNVEITDLTLVRPDVRLERDATGRGNWLLAPAKLHAAEEPASLANPPATASPAQPLAAARQPRARVAVQSIHIENGRVGWVPRPGAPPVEVMIPRLDAVASGSDGTMLLDGKLIGNGRTFAVDGRIGSLGAAFDRSAPVPWPVRLALRDATASFAVDGTIARPMRGRGLGLRFDLAVSDFAGLEPFLPPELLSIHDATASIRIGDGTAAGGARLESLTLHVGAPRLAGLPEGLSIGRADISAPGRDRPVHVDAEGESGVGTLKLIGNAATLAGVLPGSRPAHPVPIDITLDAGRARISARGTVADPATLKGVDADVSLRVPDLAAFGSLIRRRLPALSQVAFDGHVVGDLGGRGPIGVRHATLTLPQARLSGDADIRFGARPYVRATLTSQRIDVDALRADLSAPWSGGDKSAAPRRAAPPAPPVPASPWVIPDAPIDFGLLDRMDAELQIHVDALRAAGVDYTEVSGTARLRDGRLEVDPLAGQMPGGPAELRFSIDTRAPDVPMSLSLRAPSLQLAPLLSAFGASSFASGSVRTIADIKAAGRTPHAIAASLDGKLGVASIDAEIDNRLLLGLLRLARLPDVPLGGGGTTRLRRFAVRLDAARGDVGIGALVADTRRLVLLGGGSFDLGREQLALQVRPMLRLGGGTGGVVLPVRVDGGFRDPKVLMGQDGKGGPAITGNGAPDPCVPALAAAQAPTGTMPPPAAAAALEAPPPKPEKTRGPSVLDVLKNVIK